MFMVFSWILLCIWTYCYLCRYRSVFYFKLGLNLTFLRTYQLNLSFVHTSLETESRFSTTLMYWYFYFKSLFHILNIIISFSCIYHTKIPFLFYTYIFIIYLIKYALLSVYMVTNVSSNVFFLQRIRFIALPENRRKMRFFLFYETAKCHLQFEIG